MKLNKAKQSKTKLGFLPDNSSEETEQGKIVLLLSPTDKMLMRAKEDEW